MFLCGDKTIYLNMCGLYKRWSLYFLLMLSYKGWKVKTLFLSHSWNSGCGAYLANTDILAHCWWNIGCPLCRGTRLLWGSVSRVQHKVTGFAWTCCWETMQKCAWFKAGDNSWSWWFPVFLEFPFMTVALGFGSWKWRNSFPIPCTVLSCRKDSIFFCGLIFLNEHFTWTLFLSPSINPLFIKVVLGDNVLWKETWVSTVLSRYWCTVEN